MHNHRRDTDDRNGTTNDIQDMTRSDPIRPPRSNGVAFLSAIGAATLISVFVGICYYYSYHYRAAYLGRLGLDPEMLPITIQDAVAQGFEGIVINVLWVVVVIAFGVLAYIALAWGALYFLQRLFQRLGISWDTRAPHPAFVELGRNEGVRMSFLAALIAIGATLLGGTAAIMVGGPAEGAGGRDAKALLERVKSPHGRCARYELKDGSALVGWRIGSTADHQFVLGNDNATHVVKFDDLHRLIETDVPCQKLRTASPSNARQTERSK